MNRPTTQRQRAGYFTLGSLFLVAGLGMLVAEYAGGPTLDVPDVYAESSLSGSTSISSTCSPTGNSFYVPASISITYGFNSAVGGLTPGSQSITVSSGVGAQNVTAEASMVSSNSLINSTTDEATAASLEVQSNGWRMRRDVQCLGYTTPFSQAALCLSANTAGVNAFKTANSSNATTGFSAAMTTTASYIKGGTGTADGIAVDTELAELLIGGAANTSTGFGWSLSHTRDISIDTASSMTSQSITTESQLANANF